MAPKPTQFTYNYEDMQKILGKSTMNAIYHDKDRGRFDPLDLESVLLYLARHATPDVKVKLIYAITEYQLDSPKVLAEAKKASAIKKVAKKASKSKLKAAD